MKHGPLFLRALAGAGCVVLTGFTTIAANATQPCGDFGECKVLTEINASDGDIGFHFLMDGDELIRAAIYDPRHRKIFADVARGPLRRQFLTETFVESAEPLCFDPLTDDDPENDDENFVTLEDFLRRWTDGTYYFFGIGDRWELSFGQTDLTFDLPAAPAEVDYDGGVISWEAGDDLGECADADRLSTLVAAGVLPQHPQDVAVAEWEIVFEPEIAGNLQYSVRVPGDIEEKEITVPADFLASLPADTPVKVEVGAIGEGDNATFTEEGDFCINETDGCEED